MGGGPAHTDRLLSDLEFENMIVRRWHIYTIVLREVERLQESFGRVEQLLAGELSGDAG